MSSLRLMRAPFPERRSFMAFFVSVLTGYYDGVMFHRSVCLYCKYALPSCVDNISLSRVVPGFLVQTGDRTGTGNGGESFYGGNVYSLRVLGDIEHWTLQSPSKMKFTPGCDSLIEA